MRRYVFNVMYRDDADYSVALDEARRAMDSQDAHIANLRGRATTIVTLGGAVFALVGGLGAADMSLSESWLVALPLIAYVVVLYYSLRVLDLKYLWDRQNVNVLVMWTDREGATKDRVSRQFAVDLARQWDDNQVVVRRMNDDYQKSIIWLLGEFALLVVCLWKG